MPDTFKLFLPTPDPPLRYPTSPPQEEGPETCAIRFLACPSFLPKSYAKCSRIPWLFPKPSIRNSAPVTIKLQQLGQGQGRPYLWDYKLRMVITGESPRLESLPDRQSHLQVFTQAPSLPGLSLQHMEQRKLHGQHPA